MILLSLVHCVCPDLKQLEQQVSVDTAALQMAQAVTGGLSTGTGDKASASQGLTAVSTTTSNVTAGNVIHNSAANGSTAALLSSTSQTGSLLPSSANNTSNIASSNGSSNSLSASDAVGRGSAENVVADSTSVASESTPDKVGHMHRA